MTPMKLARAVAGTQLSRQWLSAMMATSQRQPILVGHADDVVRMDKFHHSDQSRGVSRGQNATPGISSINAPPAAQCLIVFENASASDGIEVARGGAKADRLSDRRCACFEAMRGRFEFAFGQSYAHDHFAPAVEWLHGLEDFLAAVENSGAGRPAHLVAGQRQKITSQLLHIN